MAIAVEVFAGEKVVCEVVVEVVRVNGVEVFC